MAQLRAAVNPTSSRKQQEELDAIARVEGGTADPSSTPTSQPNPSGQLRAANTQAPQKVKESGHAFLDGIRMRQEAIRVEKNPSAKLALISQLSSDVMSHANEVGRGITERVRNESQVEPLKQQLIEYRKGGINTMFTNLMNKRFGGENEGIALRRGLEDERRNNLRKIQLEVAQNPDIAAAQALHDPHGFLNTQSSLAKGRINRADADEIGDVNREGALLDKREDRSTAVEVANITAKGNRDAALANSKLLIEANKEVRAEERELKKAEAREVLLSSIDNEGMDLARIYSGKQANDPSTGDFIIHNLKNNKEFKEVMAAASSPDTIVDLAIEGNPVAATVAAKKQAELLSGTTDTTNDKYIGQLALAKDNLKMMKKVQVSSELEETALTSVYGSKGSMARKAYDRDTLNANLLGTKEAFAFRSNRKLQLARDFLVTSTRARFVNDVDTWGEQFTAALEGTVTYNTLVETKGKGNISVQDIVNSITAIEDPDKKAKEMQAFKEVMSGAAAQKNSAYFGFAIDNLDVEATLSRSITRTLRGDLEAILPSVAGIVKDPIGFLGQTARDSLDENFDISNYIFGKD